MFQKESRIWVAGISANGLKRGRRGRGRAIEDYPHGKIAVVEIGIGLAKFGDHLVDLVAGPQCPALWSARPRPYKPNLATFPTSFPRTEAVFGPH